MRLLLIILSTNFIKSTIFSLVLLLVIYNLCGSYGYITFGDKVKADIIQMYDARDPVVTTGMSYYCFVSFFFADNSKK